MSRTDYLAFAAALAAVVILGLAALTVPVVLALCAVGVSC